MSGASSCFVGRPRYSSGRALLARNAGSAAVAWLMLGHLASSRAVATAIRLLSSWMIVTAPDRTTSAHAGGHSPVPPSRSLPSCKLCLLQSSGCRGFEQVPRGLHDLKRIHAIDARSQSPSGAERAPGPRDTHPRARGPVAFDLGRPSRDRGWRFVNRIRRRPRYQSASPRAREGQCLVLHSGPQTTTCATVRRERRVSPHA